MKPLFEVGEEVILWPNSVESMQGVTTYITNRRFIETVGAYTGKYNPAEWNYECAIKPPRDGVCSESSLRKKPKGNGKTLTEFMDELKGLTVTV